MLNIPITANPLYDISNPHFRDTEILTSQNEILKGQFVQFKVVKGEFEYLYPSEKYCFLPKEHAADYWEHHTITNGEFREVPSYIRFLGLNDIKEIKIRPQLL
jgi:hypothetical protein